MNETPDSNRHDGSQSRQQLTPEQRRQLAARQQAARQRAAQQGGQGQQRQGQQRQGQAHGQAQGQGQQRQGQGQQAGPQPGQRTSRQQLTSEQRRQLAARQQVARQQRQNGQQARQGSSRRGGNNAAVQLSYGMDQVQEGKQKRSVGKTILGVLIALIALTGMFFGGKALLHHFTPDKLEPGTEVQVVIPEGSGASAIAEILHDSEVISSKSAFLSAVKKSNATTDLKPGTYTLYAYMDVDEVVKALVQGPIIQPDGNTLSIPEGLKATEIAKYVEDATGISAEDFMAEVYSADKYVEEFPFLEGAYDNSLEGFLYPKTYIIPDDEDAEYVVRTMLAQFQEETADLDWSYPESQGLTRYQAVVMASIVQREVGAGDYASKVARVFYNRLEYPMRLQSDVTMLYAVDWDESKWDINLENAYNTYVIDGLPAGPICNPYIATLQAVCEPADGPWLYFFSDLETGETFFTETSDEHYQIVDSYNY